MTAQTITVAVTAISGIIASMNRSTPLCVWLQASRMRAAMKVEKIPAPA